MINLGFSQYNPQGINGSGSNPYLSQNVNNALDSITRNYQNTIAPQMASRMASANSFGNTGLQAMDLAQQRGLADSLGATASQMYGSAYNTDRANDLAFTNANNANATQRYGYDQSRAASQYSADQSLAGTRYASDNSLKGSMYGADKSAAATLGAAGLSSAASMYASDNNRAASMYASDNNRAASKYSSDANLYGNLYGTDASIYNNAMNNATTQRGQDVQYGIAGLNNQTQRIGQNQTYDLGLRSNDLGYSQLDANINQQNFNNQLAGANFGLSVYDRLGAGNAAAINAGQQIQNTPLNYQNQFSNMQNSIGNGYGTTTSTTPNSAAAGALGGALAGYQLAGNLTGNLGLGGNWASGTGSYAPYVNTDYGQFF